MPGESGRQLKFDLGNLYSTAPAFRDAGSDLGDAVREATSRLESLGSFWGNDENGQKFGAVYAPYQDKLLQLLALVAGQMQGIADGVTKMADEYGAAEQKNIGMSQALNEKKP